MIHILNDKQYNYNELWIKSWWYIFIPKYACTIMRVWYVIAHMRFYLFDFTIQLPQNCRALGAAPSKKMFDIRHFDTILDCIWVSVMRAWILLKRRFSGVELNRPQVWPDILIPCGVFPLFQMRSRAREKPRCSICVWVCASVGKCNSQSSRVDFRLKVRVACKRMLFY